MTAAYNLAWQHRPDEPLLTSQEVQDRLRISRSTFNRFLKSGALRGYKVGVSWRFYESDVARLIVPAKG